MKKCAFAPVFLLFFVFIFVIVTLLTIEIYNIYTFKNHIDIEIQRGLNIAVEVATDDDYRREHISKIDAETAREEFAAYIAELQNEPGGRFSYLINIEDEEIEEGGSVGISAYYKVKGTLYIEPELVGKLFDNLPTEYRYIAIPFDVKSLNQRIR